MRKVTSLVMSMFFVAPVFADTSGADLTLSSGRPGGSYYGIQAPKIMKFFKTSGLTVTTIPSTGSLENLSNVAAGEVAQIGIAQSDAIMYFNKTNPLAGVKIEVGAPLGTECAFIVVKKDSKIESDDDLQVKGVSIAAGSPGDGARATWDYLGILEPKFKLPTIHESGGVSGLSRVTAGISNAFLFVTNPKPEMLYNNELFNLTRNNKNLKFVPITDWNINDKLPNGDSVYFYDKVVIKPGTFVDDTVKTICMNTYVVYNSGLNEETKEKMARAFLRMGASSE